MEAFLLLSLSFYYCYKKKRR